MVQPVPSRPSVNRAVQTRVPLRTWEPNHPPPWKHGTRIGVSYLDEFGHTHGFNQCWHYQRGLSDKGRSQGTRMVTLPQIRRGLGRLGRPSLYSDALTRGLTWHSTDEEVYTLNYKP